MFQLSTHKLLVYIFVAAKYRHIQCWKMIDWFEEEIFGYIYKDNSEKNFLLSSSVMNFRQHDVKFFLIHFLHLLDIFFDSNKRYVYQRLLLPNALFKSILRIFDCCTTILQLLGKRATEKTVDLITDVTKRQTSGGQR